MKAFEDLPGPTGDLAEELNADEIGALVRLAEYGPFVRFTAYGQSRLLVSDAEWIRRVQRAPFDVVGIGPFNEAFAWVTGFGLFTDYSPSWRPMRLTIQRPLSHVAVRQFGDIMVRRTEEQIGTWANGAVVDLREEVLDITLLVVAESLFGADLTADVADRIHRIIDRLGEVFLFDPTALVSDPAAMAAVGDLRREFDEVVDAIVDVRVTASDVGTDLLGTLLTATGEDGNPVSRRRVCDESMQLVLAGHDTTANTLGWALLELGHRPEHREAVRQEVEHVARGRPLEADDVRDLVFTCQVIDETLRLYPAAHFSDRRLLEDMEIGDTLVPAGTILYWSPWAVHRDPRYFPNPESFDPGRFAPEAAPPVDRMTFFPFGGGPKICVGQHFARLEATLVLAHILRSVDYELEDLSPAVPVARAVPRPREGVRARVRKLG